MKQFLIFILSSCLTTTSVFAQSSIYNLTVTRADALLYPLSNANGQTLMIVLLPAMQTASDSAFLRRIDSIAEAHAGSLQTIAVPSYEDGYTDDPAHTLLNWYKASLDSNIIISQPLYTHKSSGTQQDSLFRWLTDVTQNSHFDDEIEGACGFFFVNAEGTLYGEFEPGAKFSNKALGKVLP
jgi:glutathione peroxidase-family protein